MAPTPEELDALASRDFLRAAAARDVSEGRYDGQVVTRFPPEPNGYLHIGHAKAIVVDFGIARDFGGRCHLRMDDTNPTTETVEFAENIERDVRWLGFDWAEHLYFASDMYEDMYTLALRLIDKGLAYVDEQGLDEIRAGRGTVTEPGVESPFRNRPIAENHDLFERMRKGEFPDGAMVLRARIDMAAPNMLLRDPVIYRIKHAHHYRRGDDWCVFPMYDFAHCLEDALEGVTHSFCTLEFQDNRALYDWFIEKTEVVPLDRAPRQYEMARLEVEYIITSKRRLKQLVEEGFVEGWDDPRMPTLAGLRRRGVPPEALVAFCERVGVAKTNSCVEYALLEHTIRDHLNFSAPRRMAVLEPLELVIVNWPEGRVDATDAPDFPPDVGKPGSRPLSFSGRVWIERSDFELEPPKGYKRLSPGAVVRLRHGPVVECIGVDRTADGGVARVHARAFLDADRGAAPEGTKVKGTIHWVDAASAVPARIRLYDHLFTVPDPMGDPSGRSFEELLNPTSLVEHRGFVEASLAGAPVGSRYQLERTGYFAVDPSSQGSELVLNRTVALKDSWARKSQADEPIAPAVGGEPAGGEPAAIEGADSDKRKRKKRPARELRDEARAADPALQAAFERLLAMGIPDEDADVLSGDAATVAFFDRAVAEHADGVAVAKVVVHDLRGLAEDLSALPFDGGALGRLVALLASDAITTRAGRKVLELMVAEGGEPAAIVEAHGLAPIADADALEAQVDAVLAAHPGELARFRAGEDKLQGFFMGQLMRATRGKADPGQARELLLRKLQA